MTFPTAAATTTRRKFVGTCAVIVFPLVRLVYLPRAQSIPRLTFADCRSWRSGAGDTALGLIIRRDGSVSYRLARLHCLEYQREQHGHHKVENNGVEGRVAREGVAAEGERIGGLELRGDGHSGTGIGTDGPADQQRPAVEPSCIRAEQ